MASESATRTIVLFYAIVKKKPITFANVEADQLILWKVGSFSPFPMIYAHNFPALRSTSRMTRNWLASRAETEKVELTVSSRKLSKIFPADPPEERVSVLVEVPNIGE
jgi:hypothetical protein